MAKTFYVKTHALVDYDNLVAVDEEEMKAYQAERPDLTERDIVAEMFADGNCKVLDSTPTNWYNEQVSTVREYNTEGEENV